MTSICGRAQAEVTESMVCPNPQVSCAVLREGSDAEVCESIINLQVPDSAFADSADAFVGPDPNCAVAGLQNGPYEVVHQAFCRGVLCCPFRRDMEDSPPVGTN